MSSIMVIRRYCDYFTFKSSILRLVGKIRPKNTKNEETKKDKKSNDLGKKNFFASSKRWAVTMGGYGSGSYRGKVKATVEDQILLSINEIAFELTPGQEKVRVRLGRTPLDLNLTWSDCHFGGKRPWFVCPRCERRVGVVYKKVRYKPITISELAELARQIEYRRLLGYPIPRPRSPIGCRKCLNLNYRSQQATKVSPLERLERLDKSKAKLLKMMVKLGRE